MGTTRSQMRRIDSVMQDLKLMGEQMADKRGTHSSTGPDKELVIKPRKSNVETH